LLEVLQNAVREKPAKVEELTLLKIRLWLVLEYFKNGNFQEFWYWAGGDFPVSEREFPVALLETTHAHFQHGRLEDKPPGIIKEKFSTAQ